ncbi:hypothetical protein OC709_01930 ['Planchonia careya' phytoplasma]|nr:hypothetical protein ['Planchonia careya' phytoplasma]
MGTIFYSQEQKYKTSIWERLLSVFHFENNLFLEQILENKENMYFIICSCSPPTFFFDPVTELPCEHEHRCLDLVFATAVELRYLTFAIAIEL